MGPTNVYTEATTMANKLSSAQLKEYKETFQTFDKNGNGTINSMELATAMRSFGMRPTPKEIENMIKEVDADRSGFVDFDEFVSLMTKRVSKTDKQRELMDAFKTFDRNSDGFIIKSEFQKVMKKHGEKMTSKEIDKMLRESDIDKDGKINYVEFVKMVR